MAKLRSGSLQLLATLSALLVVPICCIAQNNQAWKTGEALKSQLQFPLQASFRNSPLKTSVRRIAAAQRVCIWLDRRVDPSQKLNLSVNESPLQVLLAKLADENDLELGWIGPVAYLSSEGGAHVAQVMLHKHLTTIRAQTSAVKKRWANKRSLAWPELSEPRKLVVAACEKAGIKISNPQKIPHDLWDEQDFPPLDLAHQLTLLLNGFGLTFNVKPDGNIVITNIPWNEKIRDEYSFPKENSAELPAKFTALGVQKVGTTKLQFSGRIKDHALLLAWLAKLKSEAAIQKTTGNPAVPVGTTVYTLTIQNQPFEPVIRALAKKIGMQLALDAEISQQKRTQLITFKVENASLPDLIKAATKQVDLDFTIDKNSIRVTER